MKPDGTFGIRGNGAVEDIVHELAAEPQRVFALLDRDVIHYLENAVRSDNLRPARPEQECARVEGVECNAGQAEVERIGDACIKSIGCRVNVAVTASEALVIV